MSSKSCAVVHMRRRSLDDRAPTPAPGGPCRAVIRAGARGPAIYAPAVLVEAWLTRAVRTRPDRAAVNGLAYSELAERADGVARALHAGGLSPGVRLGIALPPGEDFAVAMHAAWRLRCPVEPGAPDGGIGGRTARGLAARLPRRARGARRPGLAARRVGRRRAAARHARPRRG